MTINLERSGQRLVIARDLGQVGDLLAESDTDVELEVFRTIPAAIAALERLTGRTPITSLERFATVAALGAAPSNHGARP